MSDVSEISLPLNTYIVGDCLEHLRNLPGNSIKGVVTSPPYNKRRYISSSSRTSKAKGMLLFTEQYESYDDAMSPAEYIDWQKDVLSECWRIIQDDGVIFYNIGVEIRDLTCDLRTKIIEDFNLRQLIIWDRGSTMNLGGSVMGFLPPVYELIYVLAKPDYRIPDEVRSQAVKWTSVWRINPERHNAHPAPFPIELANRMVKLVGQGTVLDPFAGSGTTMLAAELAGNSWIGIDLSQKYKNMFYSRLNKLNSAQFR